MFKLIVPLIALALLASSALAKTHRDPAQRAAVHT